MRADSDYLYEGFAVKKIYLDNAATTPTDARVLEAMLPFFSQMYGNPSSLHAFGQEAKHAIEEARYITAQFIGAQQEEIVFTSGGTESNNAAIKGVTRPAIAIGTAIAL